jgi:hypothetical protein
MIFKNLVLQALGTIWFRFLQKNYLKKFHACVPLTSAKWLTISPGSFLAWDLHRRRKVLTYISRANAKPNSVSSSRVHPECTASSRAVPGVAMCQPATGPLTYAELAAKSAAVWPAACTSDVGGPFHSWSHSTSALTKSMLGRPIFSSWSLVAGTCLWPLLGSLWFYQTCSQHLGFHNLSLYWKMLNVHTCTAALVGKHLNDLLFAVDHQSQLLCSSCVLVISNTEVLTVW